MYACHLAYILYAVVRQQYFLLYPCYSYCYVDEYNYYTSYTGYYYYVVC